MLNSSSISMDEDTKKLLLWNTLQPAPLSRELISGPVEPTRDFCARLLTAQIEGLAREAEDTWKDHQEFERGQFSAAKTALLGRIIEVLPEDEAGDQGVYRLVLQHGDFGIHNMTVSVEDEVAKITSLYDWETGCVVPAILADVGFSLPGFDIGVDTNGKATVNVRTPGTDQSACEKYANMYLDVSCCFSPPPSQSPLTSPPFLLPPPITWAPPSPFPFSSPPPPPSYRTGARARRGGHGLYPSILEYRPLRNCQSSAIEI